MEDLEKSLHYLISLMAKISSPYPILVATVSRLSIFLMNGSELIARTEVQLTNGTEETPVIISPVDVAGFSRDLGMYMGPGIQSQINSNQRFLVFRQKGHPLPKGLSKQSFTLEVRMDYLQNTTLTELIAQRHPALTQVGAMDISGQIETQQRVLDGEVAHFVLTTPRGIRIVEFDVTHLGQFLKAVTRVLGARNSATHLSLSLSALFLEIPGRTTLTLYRLYD